VITSPTPATTEIASRDGVSIFVDDFSNAEHAGAAEVADAAPILLLHGAGQTRHSWAGTARRLSVLGFRVVSMDLRGHGDSSWDPEHRYELVHHAADTRCVIDWLGESPTLIGASLGGLTGIVLEGEYAPGSIASLVLVDIVPRLSMNGADRVRNFMRTNVETGFASLDEAADAVANYNRHRPRPDSNDGLRKNLRERDGRWYWHWDPHVMFRDTDEPAKVHDGRYLTDILHQVSTPVMLVRGRMSDLVTDAITAEFRSEFPDAVYADVTGAGHMVAGDRNDAFTSAIESFVLGQNAL